MQGSIELANPRELREADENPRRIRDERYEDLKRTLTASPRLMEARPLIVDAESGDVVAGNMRLRAVLELGWRQVPIYRKRFESDAERREWMLLDNQPFGEWVPEEVAALVAAHEAEGRDLSLLGFAAEEAAGLLALAREASAEPGGLDGANPDDAPPAPEQPVTERGDLWLLGEHRLLCGRAEDPDDLNRLVAGHGAVECIWTDPPYGVGYDAETRVSYFSPERLAQAFGTIEGDEARDVAEYGVWLTDVLNNICGPLAEGGAVYLCHADKMVEAAAHAFREAGLYLSSQLIWLKSVLVFGRSDYHYKHEPLLYGWKRGAAHRWHGDRSQTTIFEVASDHYGEDRQAYAHPTQKPYKLVAPALENSTQIGEVVLDPFGGSGTTLIACERLGRLCRMMEMEPRYCDVIVKRWESFTGQQAERAS